MAITGKFIHASNDNYEAWLVSIGVPAEAAAKYNAAKPVLEVTSIEGGITVKTTAGDKVFSNNVIFGKETEIDIAGLKYSVNIEPSGNGYKGTFKFGAKNGTVTIEESGSGIVQTVTADGVVSKRTYTKQ